jgi:hypothetical protein
MLRRLLLRAADNKQSTSLATRLRRERFRLFLELLGHLEPPIRILDVGGTQRFWETMEWPTGNGVRITLLNVTGQPVSSPTFTSVVGDGRQMTQFTDASFDVVFSNSVIEHVGAYEDQRRMAAEVRRVGQRYFVQTPNKFFPIEPHFLFPLFQFLPLPGRAWLVNHFHLGWQSRIADREKAKAAVASIRLLSKGELIRLFPEARIFEERFLGLAKSFVAYAGWE